MNLSTTEYSREDLETIADRRLIRTVAEYVGLNPRTERQATWDFIVFVRDNHWTAEDKAAGVEIDAVVSAKPSLYGHWIEFKTWIEDSYGFSDAKANGITIEELLISREAYAEFLEHQTPPPPTRHPLTGRTVRVTTHDDRHTAGSESVHAERFGYLAGHPYKATRIRSRHGLSKTTTMRFPDWELFDWQIGATKYSDGRKVVKTGVMVHPTQGCKNKPIKRVVLRSFVAEAC